MLNQDIHRYNADCTCDACWKEYIRRVECGYTRAKAMFPDDPLQPPVNLNALAIQIATVEAMDTDSTEKDRLIANAARSIAENAAQGESEAKPTGFLASVDVLSRLSLAVGVLSLLFWTAFYVSLYLGGYR